MSIKPDPNGRRFLVQPYRSLIGVFGSLVLTLAACDSGAHRETLPQSTTDSSESSVTRVTIAPVEHRQVERTIQAVGTLQGYETITISPKIEGRVAAIPVDVGDRISPGTLILELDATDYELAVAESERSLNQELARLGIANLPAGDFDSETNPSVMRARLLFENASQQLEREAKLFGSNASTAQALENAQTELRVAEANLVQTRLEIQSLLATARFKQAVLDQARNRLSETRVLAPRLVPDQKFPGSNIEFVVVNRMVSVGEMVRAFPSTPVLELVIDDVLKLRAKVPERFLSQVLLGQTVQIQVDAWPGEIFSAQVSRIYPSVDPLSRTFEVEALVLNGDHRLKHGGFAKAAVVTAANTQSLTVPREAVVSFAGVTKVFRIREGLAEEVPVSLGTRGENWVEVIGELKAREWVATSGQSRLAQGTQVQVRHTTAQVPANSTPEKDQPPSRSDSPPQGTLKP